jgi:hypothetical protein
MMLKRILIPCLLIVLMSTQSVIGAQDYTAKLNATLEKIKGYFAEKKPGWEHEAVEPIRGSRNVSVNNWVSEGHGIRVSIIAYGSEADAKAAMRRFAADERTLDRLPDLCDGGYSWGMGGSNIAFRKGDVTIWVSGSKTNLREGVALSKEFAALIAEALCAT